MNSAWLQAFADETGFPHGIVAECHLARPDAAAVLDRHLQFRNVRGVRNFGEGNYLIDPAWRRGYAELAKRDLVYCLDTRIERAADVLDLAQSFPDIAPLHRPLRDSDAAYAGVFRVVAVSDPQNGEGA